MSILQHVKKYYLDSADPDGKALHLAIRSALACFISIVLFQYMGKEKLAGWAGFAALAFIQIDMLEVVSKRLKFLIGSIFVFVILALIGIGLSKYYLWFTLTVPLVIFICGYISCLGNQYYNAGGWAGFLYIAFGSSLGGASHAKEVAITFIVIGILCVFLSITIFPDVPLNKIKQSFKRILIKFCDLHSSGEEIYRRKINQQLENLLAIQNTTIHTYLAVAKLSKIQENCIVNASKSIQQIVLMSKSIDARATRLSIHNNYPVVLFQKCQNTTLELIKNVLKQLNASVTTISELELGATISGYRDDLKIIQKYELSNPEPNFASLLDYSSYLYHFIKLWQTITQLSSYLGLALMLDESLC